MARRFFPIAIIACVLAAPALATPAVHCDERADGYSLPEGYTPIHLLTRRGPAYPAAMYQNGIEGSVTVLIDVLSDGTTTNIEITEATPPSGFNQTVIDTVSQWRFRPHTINGIASVCEGVSYHFDFNIDPVSPE